MQRGKEEVMKWGSMTISYLQRNSHGIRLVPGGQRQKRVDKGANFDTQTRHVSGHTAKPAGIQPHHAPGPLSSPNTDEHGARRRLVIIHGYFGVVIVGK